MQIIVRPARAEELQAAEELVVRSINDLTVRHGFGAMASLRPADFQQFSLNDDPDGLWVAEADGELAGFAFSWISGNFWFLAELFVSPDHQGRGIGDTLLKRTFEHAAKADADNKALITFTFNTVSQGLYIRRGLYPGFRSTSSRPRRGQAANAAPRSWIMPRSETPIGIGQGLRSST